MRAISVYRLVGLFTVCLAILVVVVPGPALAGGPPEGKGAKQWIALYTYDLPLEEWLAGEHRYDNSFSTTYPEDALGPDDELRWRFIVDPDAPLYDGYVLLRHRQIMVRVAGPGGAQCQRLSTDGDDLPAINPNQPLRFAVAWLSDYPMTRKEANAHFASLVATARLDDGDWVWLEHHGIKPYGEKGFGLDQWDHYVCSFTRR